LAVIPSSRARNRSGSVEFVDDLAAYNGFCKAVVTTQEEFRVPEKEDPESRP
jgi:hypothetical protein